MLDPEREDLVERGSIWDWVPTLLAFLAIYTTLFIFYRPNLLFGITTTAGGDTGAHHYPAQYLIQELLPHFRLTGWAPGWYAGMPMLTFYFPFPFLLIAIMDWFMAYEVAFKIATALGVFALPAAAYAMGRLWRVRRPFPTLAAVFGLIFLLMESYSIYGGNILSTLAGEFGYMLSFALVFLFLGTMYRGMEKPRFNMLFVLNCLILMALVLSHIVTTIVLVCYHPRAALGQSSLALPGLHGRSGRGGILPDRLLVSAVRRQPRVDGSHGLEPTALPQRSPAPATAAGRHTGTDRDGLRCGPQGEEASAACLDHRHHTGALLGPT